MKRAILATAALLALPVVAAGQTGWKWCGFHHARAVDGWTWDDSAVLGVDTANPPSPITEGEAVTPDQLPQVTDLTA